MHAKMVEPSFMSQKLRIDFSSRTHTDVEIRIELVLLDAHRTDQITPDLLNGSHQWSKYDPAQSSHHRLGYLTLIV